MRKTLTLFGTVATLVLTAFATMHFSGTATSIAAAESATATNQDAKAYRIDGVHSSVVFGVRHLNVANFYGRFNDISGEIAWDADSPSSSSISIEIKAESVDTNNRGRDDHLRTPDFFNVREFPTITFNSTKIEKKGDAYRVTGQLNMHGVEREVALDLKHTGETTHPRSGKHIVGFESHFTVKRSEHRMTYGIEQNMLGDEVKLIVSIEAIEQ